MWWFLSCDQWNTDNSIYMYPGTYISWESKWNLKSKYIYCLTWNVGYSGQKNVDLFTMFTVFANSYHSKFGSVSENNSINMTFMGVILFLAALHQWLAALHSHYRPKVHVGLLKKYNAWQSHGIGIYEQDQANFVWPSKIAVDVLNCFHSTKP